MKKYFAMTYGDGVANIDLAAELAFHRSHGKQATVAAVRPAKRFGAISIEGDHVKEFPRKSRLTTAAGLMEASFCSHRAVGKLIAGDSTVWEEGTDGSAGTD